MSARQGEPARSTRPARALHAVANARTVAYDVIAAVRESDAYANLLLPTRIERAGLDQADAALATELTYGTLRMRGYYDRVIALAARRDVDAIDAPVLDVLRLAAHQLLSMRIPSHAAVNEAVSLARTVGSRSATGFANGVLRTIARTEPEVWRARVAQAASDSDDRLAALHSHPVWIVRALRHALNAEHRAAELEALLEADNAAPRVNLVALPGVADQPQGATPNRFSPIGFTLSGRDPLGAMRAPGGGIRAQDEGSQLAALTLIGARPVQPGERWLDLCAGPGGKAALLGAEALRSGARLTANELVPARVDLVRSAVAPVADAVDVVLGDGISFGDQHPEKYDRVLLDAPCTGLGALRRRPEARWRKTPRDVAELGRLQAALLDSAVAALKPGGVLCYVTCSPHLAESRIAVADVLKRHPAQLTELPTRDALARVARDQPDLAGDPAQVQLWPHRHGTDAMFIALLGKRPTAESVTTSRADSDSAVEPG
ncbi:MAG TPA: transcription antitermination factor NusB [Humibacter sp.]|nr:transcription antitermination factor NusB [Humibacter sp.]